MKIQLIMSLFLVSIATSQTLHTSMISLQDILSYIESNAGDSYDTSDVTNKYIKYNYSSIFQFKDQKYRIGYIGNNLQRFYIYFSSVVRDSLSPTLYNVIGKTRVKTNICEFKGTLKIIGTRELKGTADRCDDGVNDSLIGGITIFAFRFTENPELKYSGIIEGLASSQWYIDSLQHLQYDDLWSCSDFYNNCMFIGSWKGYNSTQIKKCNWGDFRIPFPMDLDSGAGEFYPNDKYASYGWKKFQYDNNLNWWK